MSLTRYAVRHTVLSRHLKSMVSLKARNLSERPESAEESADESHFEHINESFFKLYDDHIATTTTQKVALALGSAFKAITDPYRHDMVAVFGETTGQLALKNLYKQMSSDPEGRLILEDNPRINSRTIDIERLATLPEQTFGRCYYNFLKTNGVTPDSRRPVKFVDDVHSAQVMQRYREIHDMVHTLLDMPTNMLGEVVVKWVEAIQTDLPMCWLGGLFGAVRLAPKQRRNYVKTYLPWALRCGHEAKPLINVYYEKRFEQNIDDLRRELNIPPIPRTS